MSTCFIEIFWDASGRERRKGSVVGYVDIVFALDIHSTIINTISNYTLIQKLDPHRIYRRCCYPIELFTLVCRWFRPWQNLSLRSCSTWTTKATNPLRCTSTLRVQMHHKANLTHLTRRHLQSRILCSSFERLFEQFASAKRSAQQLCFFRWVRKGADSHCRMLR